MDDLIRRQDAIKAMQEQKKTLLQGLDKDGVMFGIITGVIGCMVATVGKAPAAQPERKTGHWQPWEYARPGYEYKFHKCSVCGVCDEYVSDVPRPNGTIARLERIRNYCPNCGAKMEG